MQKIATLDELHGLYGAAGTPALRKVVDRLTPMYRRWIMTSRLCIVSTVGPEGVDGSPRGDDGPVVLELDETHLALPDWRGNNRLDTLRNIVRDPRVALMFVVPGSNNVVRVNGRGFVTADSDLRARFDKAGRQPVTVVVIKIEEIYSQCARALMRAKVWGGADESTGLPSVGDLLSEATQGTEGGALYDENWAGRAAKTMW